MARLASRRLMGAKDFLRRYGVLVAFVLLFAANAVWKPDVFLQPENLRNLLNQNAAVGIIAVGMTLVIITGGFDLSVGSMAALVAAFGLLALNKSIIGGGSEGVAVLIMVIVCAVSGALLGAFNGVLIAYGRIAPFVATLAGFVGFRSLCLAIANGGEIRSASAELLPGIGRGGIPLPFLITGGGKQLVITWGIVLFIAAAIVATLILGRTRLGRQIYAVGGNERAAHYSGVNTARVKMAVYTLVGLFTGVAAFTLAARMNSVASSTTGRYYELDAIAAVVIGGTSLSGGTGRIWGTFLGVLLLGMITNMLVVADVSVYWQGAVKGSVILLAVLIQRAEGIR